VQAQIAATGVVKSSKVEDQGRMYASVDAIAEVATQCLGAAGLLVITEYYPQWHLIDAWEKRKRTGQNTILIGQTHGWLTLIHGSSGSFLGPFHSRMPIMWRIQAPHDKAFAASQSYLHSYMLRNLLNLPRIDEKHDVDKQHDGPPNGSAPSPTQQHPQTTTRTTTPAANKPPAAKPPAPKPPPAPKAPPEDPDFTKLKADTKAAAKIYTEQTGQKWGDIAVIALGDEKARANRRFNREQVDQIRSYLDLSGMKFDATNAPILTHEEFQQLLAGSSRAKPDPEPKLDNAAEINPEDIPF
jgi:hypothetical protein